MMGFIWFWLVAVMIVGYVVLDGFDLGVGVLHLFLVAPKPSVAPPWPASARSGTATRSGSWPAAAPSTSPSPCSMPRPSALLPSPDDRALAAGSARVSLELRNHVEVGVWRGLLDGVFGLASALLAVFFGAALANVLRGVPLQADGYFFLPLWTNWQPGVQPGILDWYTVIGGVLALVALTLHGALCSPSRSLAHWRSSPAASSLRSGSYWLRLQSSASSPPSPSARPA